jgi:alpha-galactosidase
VPRENGSPALPPATVNTWFAYKEGNEVTEANQLESMAAMRSLGVEAFWLDAGWFEGGWPSGVGSWVPKKQAFPNGLKPLGAAAHQAGLKFVLWFEPERVNPASRIGREHPEFVLGWKNGKSGDGLFNLGDPAARAWLTELLSGTIKEAGVDIYRNDFNMAPLPFWQKADEPDRQGITENRYVEGLYSLWDELRKRHPGLLIDNCASGGRRIDLETCTRSYPLWRSDTQCAALANDQTGTKWDPQNNSLWDQAQTAGLSLYVPLHAAGMWGCDKYSARSVATTGGSLCQDVRSKDFSREAALAAIREMKELRPLYQGDFYPLADVSVKPDVWCAWQFDRPELGRGFAMFFRRPKATGASFEAALQGLDPKARYEVTFAEADKVERHTGAELSRLKVEIDSAPGSLLVTYRNLAP